MIALIQRVHEASVTVADDMVGSIGPGMLILLGVHEDDTAEEAEWLARKCACLRIFGDEDNRMNLSLQDVAGEALVVSQFTLYADTSRGNRPSFTSAAGPDKADALYERFAELLDAQLEKPVQMGIFGAMMNVRLTNDGPVTLWLERRPGGS